MRFNRHLIALSCLAAASGANAMALGDSGFEFYGNLYPQEQQVSHSGGKAAIDTTVDSMPKGKTACTPVGQDCDEPWKWNAVNSYLAMKWQRKAGGTAFGIDIQRFISQGVLIGTSRNAFVFVSNDQFGGVKLGQFDTAYKTAGDDLSFLGVSSSNFMSTSSLLSDVTWGASKSTFNMTGNSKPTSFHVRPGNQFMYESPAFNNFNILYSTTSKDSLTGQSNSAVALQWRKGPYYVSVQQETHQNFRAIQTVTSGFSDANSSTDTGRRLSVSYKPGAFKIAADFATLKFSQNGVASGKVNGYSTNTSQVSVEYALNSAWKVAANHATNGAGSCTISGGAACLTGGLGANQTTVGVQYKVNKNTNLTLAQVTHNWNDNAGSNSSKTAPAGYGGSQKATVVNFQYKF